MIRKNFYASLCFPQQHKTDRICWISFAGFLHAAQRECLFLILKSAFIMDSSSYRWVQCFRFSKSLNKSLFPYVDWKWIGTFWGVCLPSSSESSVGGIFSSSSINQIFASVYSLLSAEKKTKRVQICRADFYVDLKIRKIPRRN